MNPKSHDEAALQRLLDDPFKEDIAALPPLWHGSAQNEFRERFVPFLGRSFDEMAEFVLRGTGISVAEFDRDSPKPLSSLYAELEREVSLAWNRSCEPTREIVRFASNARGITYSSFEDQALSEIGRIIIESGTAIMHDEPKPFSCSETTLERRKVRPNVQTADTSMTTIIRAYIEEAGIGIDSHHFVLLTKTPEVSDHHSSVFRCSKTLSDDTTPRLCIRSIVASSVYGLDIVSLGMKTFDAWAEACPRVVKDADLLLVEDQGVLLLQQPLPLPDPWRAMLRAKLAQR